MHGGPAGDVGAFPAGGGDGPGLDELVEHLAEEQVGRGVRHRGRVVGLDRAERDGEQARLAQRELDVRPAGLAQPAPAPAAPGRSLVTRVQPPLHGLLELGHRQRGDLGEQLVAVGEVPVGRVVRHARAAGHLAQHDAVGPARRAPARPRRRRGPRAGCRGGTASRLDRRSMLTLVTSRSALDVVTVYIACRTLESTMRSQARRSSLTVCAAVLAINLDTTIVNVALPSISTDLDAGTRAAAVDRRRLQPRLRRPGAGGGQPVRPLRPAPGADPRAWSASPAPASVGALVDSSGALIAARFAMGMSAARDLPDDAVDHQQHLPRAARARGRARRLGCRRRHRRRRRPGRRRPAARALRLGQRLLGAGPARPGDGRGGVRAGPRVARPRRTAARPARARPLGRDARRAGLHDHRGARARLGVGRTRSAASRSAPCSCWSFVSVERRTRPPDARRHPVPRPAVQRRERGGHRHVLRAVRLHLPDHAVLPVRARVRHPLDRRPDPAGGPEHRRRLGRRCACSRRGSAPRSW